MKLKKNQIPIFAVFAFIMIVYSIIFIKNQNYEFMIYMAVIVGIFLLILKANDKIIFPNNVLWGLTVWALMHFSGSGLYIKGVKLYELILIDIIGKPYNILKYDQVVHIFGFGVATLTMYYILKPLIKKDNKKFKGLAFIILMAGLGTGALNEILEFSTTWFFETGVGGYVNNALDLVANFIGALAVVVYVYYIDYKPKAKE